MRKKRLKVPPQMICTDPRVIGPRRKRTEKCSGQNAGKSKDRSYERPGPASAEVRKLRYRFCEENLVSIALKITQDRCTEDRGDNDDAEQARRGIVVGIRKGAVQQNFAVRVSDNSEAFRRDIQERVRQPNEEVNIRRNAFAAKANLESKELPKHCHMSPER